MTWIFLTAAIIASCPQQAGAARVVYWGLYHEKPGQVPVGEASDEYLSKYDACFHGPSPDGEKNLYLTFDTGYENGNTAKILDSLKTCGVTAAFFVTGACVKTDPDLINRMVNEGHIVGNHTMSHPDMSGKSAEGFAAELKKAEKIYKSVTGREMKKFYRPPQGIFSEGNLAAAKWLGFKTVLWSVCYKDWLENSQPSREQALKTLIPRLHPGAIIMLHSTSSTSAGILPEFIAECREMGYTFKSLDEL